MKHAPFDFAGMPSAYHFAALRAMVYERATTLLAQPEPVLRTAPTVPLFDTFLGALPAALRAEHTCNACAAFMRRYGGLVLSQGDGTVVPVCWPQGVAGMPKAYHEAIHACTTAVLHAPITGIFAAPSAVLGTPVSHGTPWTHLWCMQPTARTVRHGAVAQEDYVLLQRALGTYAPDHVRTAVALLRGEHLPRHEKLLSMAVWLLGALEHTQGARRDTHARNVFLWHTVALVPPGFVHVQRTVLGTLLEDIRNGVPFDTMRRRLTALLHPAYYQRPQAAPRSGQIDHAERIITKLGVARALERRYAQLDELHTLWTPRALRQGASRQGMFSHLRAGATPARVDVTDAPRITWHKFATTVLPSARRVELFVPAQRAAFAALTTALHADAPPILQWDRDGRRNPFAWYMYVGGSPASVWALTPNTWVDVTAVVARPSAWNTPLAHHADAVILVLKDCHDTQTGQGNALFPECLRGELREVRATIEAFSKRAVLHGREQATACGLVLTANAAFAEVRVTALHHRATFVIDRWD